MRIFSLSSAIDRAGLLSGAYNTKPVKVAETQATQQEADAFLLPLIQILYKINSNKTDNNCNISN